MNQNDKDVNLLAVFHYVVAGLAALYGLLPIFHLGLGIAMVTGKLPGGPQGPPSAVGWIFIVGAGGFMLWFWLLAVLILVAGLKMAGRRGHTFCTIVGGVQCLFMPFGTVLGIFTILVLSRPAVKAQFEAGLGPPAAGDYEDA